MGLVRHFGAALPHLGFFFETPKHEKISEVYFTRLNGVNGSREVQFAVN